MSGLVFAGQGNATTWVTDEVDDPIVKDDVCLVQSPGSSGSYIYQWPSKYDQVFWPLTTAEGIWHCSKSGFTAFIGDFALSSQEENTIRAYLKTHYQGKNDIESKLQMLEQLYALRDTTAAFDNRLLRTMARWYQSLGKLDKANDYRRKAFNDIKQTLNQGPEEYLKLEYLYLGANYARQFGDKAQSDIYLTKLADAIKNLKNAKYKGFAEYLKILVVDTKKIKSGGTLEPQIKAEKH